MDNPAMNVGFVWGFLLWAHSLVNLIHNERLLRGRSESREKGELAQGP